MCVGQGEKTGAAVVKKPALSWGMLLIERRQRLSDGKESEPASHSVARWTRALHDHEARRAR